MSLSPADMCENCTKCDKGFKIRINEAYTDIKIKITVGGILKLSGFVRTLIWLPQTKAFF